MTHSSTNVSTGGGHVRLPSALDDVRPDGEALLAAIATTRDRTAFAQLFAWYAPRVKGQLMAAGVEATAAEDLAQEVMLNVWRKAGQYDPRRGAVSTWIYTMARNRFLNSVRRHPAPEPDLFEASPDNPLETDILGRERDRMLDAALTSLPDEQREALRGAYFSGHSLRELAERYRLPLGTMKTRVRLALEKMRKVVKNGRQG